MQNTSDAVMVPWTFFTRSLIFKAALFCLLLLPVCSVQAEQVVTIYFCGTGLKNDAYDPDKNKFHDPELIASLYQADASVEIEQGPWQWESGVWWPPSHSTNYSDPHYHHKYIVNGIGTSPTSDGSEIFDEFFANLGAADPNLGPRNWHNIILEAEWALYTIYTNHPGETYTVNLVGFSRGGVLTMLMARSILDYSYVRKINILAYDPVPGILNTIGYLGANLSLGSRVNQYVGIYAEDERTFMFEPVIPQINTSTTRKLIVTVPGAHETMVGNHQWDAHGSTALQTPNDGKNPNFAYVGQVSRVIAEQLLTSLEWGNVPLAKDTTIGTGGVDTAEEFEMLVTNMWHQNYASTRDYAFFPAWGIYDVRFPARLLGRDYMLRDLFLLFNPGMPARLCFVAPNRHSSEFVWWMLTWFSNPDQVYWLPLKASRITPATWDTLQVFGGTSLQDTVPPVPTIAALDPLVGQCSVTISDPPTAQDNVDGTIIGTTTGPLIYTHGTNTITWTYADAQGNIATQAQTIIVQDTTPPQIDQLSATPNVLWPPNHKMIPVTITAAALDNCSASPMSKILSVSVNEPINGARSDWEITGDLSLNLRAGRSGNASGRIYTITVQCTDDNGNSSIGNVYVTVPHDSRPQVQLPASSATSIQ